MRMYVLILLTLAVQPLYAQSWEGYYLGVHGGSVETNIKQTGTAIPGGPPPTVGNSTGTFGYKGTEEEFGVFFGRNYQAGRRVFGWEFSVSKGGEADLESVPPSTDFYVSNNKVGVDLCFRYGVLWGHDTLFYFTAGPSYLHNELDWRFAVNESINQDLLGLTVGGGVEQRLGVGNLRVEVVYSEYLADDFTAINFPNVNYSDINDRVQVRLGYSVPLGKRQPRKPIFQR